MPFLNNYRQIYSPYTDYMNGQGGRKRNFNLIKYSGVYLKVFMALLAVFTVHPIMVLVIYQNKNLSMVIPYVAIDLIAMDEVVVDDAIEMPKAKSLSDISSG